MVKESEDVSDIVILVTYDTAYDLIYNATSAEADIPVSIYVYTGVEEAVYSAVGRVMDAAVYSEAINNE